MKLSAPKRITFLISVLLLILAVILQLGVIKALDPAIPYAFLVAVASQVVLMIGCAIKGF